MRGLVVKEKTMETPMTELKENLLEEIQKLDEEIQVLNNAGFIGIFPMPYIKGCREALKNVANDIDAQLLQKEKEYFQSVSKNEH